MATSVTTELATGLTASGLTKVASATCTKELAGGVSAEEPKLTFADKSEIWAIIPDICTMTAFEITSTCKTSASPDGMVVTGRATPNNRLQQADRVWNFPLH